MYTSGVSDPRMRGTPHMCTSGVSDPRMRGTPHMYTSGVSDPRMRCREIVALRTLLPFERRVDMHVVERAQPHAVAPE